MILNEISLVAETSRRLSYCAVHEMSVPRCSSALTITRRRVGLSLCGVSFVLGGKKRAAVEFAVDTVSLEQRSLFLKHNRYRGQVNTSKVAFYGIAESL
jgi:hypothetical protein